VVAEPGVEMKTQRNGQTLEKSEDIRWTGLGQGDEGEEQVKCMPMVLSCTPQSAGLGRLGRVGSKFRREEGPSLPD
jgi:hypothetical protein